MCAHFKDHSLGLLINEHFEKFLCLFFFLLDFPCLPNAGLVCCFGVFFHSLIIRLLIMSVIKAKSEGNKLNSLKRTNIALPQFCGDEHSS